MKILWLLSMAWRDARKNKSRLLLFMSSIILGIAALVAINSFSYNLRNQIDIEAKALLSADLQVDSRKPIDKEIYNFFDSLNVQTTDEISFGSMVLFPQSNGTRLVNVRAIGKSFPFYGKLVTEPSEAYNEFGTSQTALVDQTLMLQFGAKTGDQIKIGDLIFTIAGSVMKVPGQSGITSTVAPPVFIPVQYMDATNLAQKGSRINYSIYVKYPEGFEESLVEETIIPRLESADLGHDDVENRKKQVGNAYGDLTGFLNLTAFVALLLGCIGVASSVHIYMKEKVNPVAILRCLGVSGNDAMGIFLIQVFFLGLIGSVAGAALGAAIQFYLPTLFAEILPFDVEIHLIPIAIVKGLVTGMVSSVLFSLFPLVAVRKISPLRALRATVEGSKTDRVTYLMYLLVVLFLIVFSYLQLGSWKNAVIFSTAILLSFGVLTAFAMFVIWMVRRYFPVNGSFILRQGLANLYRPNNQTLVLIVTIGLGTILITSLFMSQQMLMNKLQFTTTEESRPNMVVFDIRDQDIDQVKKVAVESKLPDLGSVPIVSMRLQAINGRTVDELKKDTTSNINEWVLDREYRVTYRDTLSDSEKITMGKWEGNVSSPSDTVYVSIADNFADDMDVKVGSTITFNVQGAMIKTVVGSIREVDFQRLQPNFLVLFPAGVLENAPKFHVFLTRFNTPEQSASFQQALVLRFPNVSIIDLNLILETVDSVLKKVSFIIQFMALFSIITGVLVLIGSVIISKYQRIRESVLLRTIGASRNQIFGINAMEYFLIGSLAALTGILISVALNIAMAQYTFKAVFAPDFIPLFICYLLIVTTTIVIGLFNSREVVSKPPLEILRNEG